MDDTGLMGDGSGSTFEVIPDVDLSTYKSLTADITVDHAPATITFGFGESSPFQQTTNFRIATAGVAQRKRMSLTSILAANRNEVQYFGVIPAATPTAIPDITVSADHLTAHYYDTETPVLPYRIFHEKLLRIDPISHGMGPVHEASRIGGTSLVLDNKNAEFYRILDAGGLLNRRADISLGFQDFPDTELQTIFKGLVRSDSINDERYVAQLEDVIKRLIRDLPPNVIQNKQYADPSTALSPQTVLKFDITKEVPPQASQGKPIPLPFGRCFIPIYPVYTEFQLVVPLPRASHLSWRTPWLNAYIVGDTSFGTVKKVHRLVRGTYAGQYHAFGSEITSLAPLFDVYGPAIPYYNAWYFDQTNGIIYTAGNLYTVDRDPETTGDPQTDPVLEPQVTWFAEVDGYQDDANGTWTGTANALIENPSDVVRFLLFNVLGLEAGDVDLSSLDTARTVLNTLKIARGISDRESAFDLLGGRAGSGGLGSNIFSYFFSSNISGKLKLLQANTSYATSNTYRATGMHSSIIRGSYELHSQPDRILTRIEVDSGYNVASAGDHSVSSVIDAGAESYLHTNTKEPMRVRAKWLPRDFQALSVGYIGTYTNYPKAYIVNDDSYGGCLFRFTSNVTAQNFDLTLGGPSAQTVGQFITTLDNKSYLTCTLTATGTMNRPSSIATSMDARALRFHPKGTHEFRYSFDAFFSPTQSFARVAVNQQINLDFSYGRMLACQYLDKYNSNVNAVRWRVPWIGFEQELGQFVDVRSLGDTQSRTVRILETRRDPMAGTIEFSAEEI